MLCFLYICASAGVPFHMCTMLDVFVVNNASWCWNAVYNSSSLLLQSSKLKGDFCFNAASSDGRTVSYIYLELLYLLQGFFLIARVNTSGFNVLPIVLQAKDCVEPVLLGCPSKTGVWYLQRGLTAPRISISLLTCKVMIAESNSSRAEIKPCRNMG